ncbi:MAG: bifunctional indole-3-glycerol phosphate synthase/phosphoribosylanthranilate isomerase, partial [Treponema sp.]|nr:bifunctional indole-3-glycerol phosphate synthase/phosphoribosylanthranilate isomerase [Treponema sp.]
MKDILTQIVEGRLLQIKERGIDFGFTLPEKRSRRVHRFLPGKGVILEVKRASPSKGDIAPELDAAKTALSYCESGASAISCLTEENFFKGSLADLMNVCSAVDEYERTFNCEGPAVLRKDFIVSEEEVDVAFRAGADAVLLISRILSKEKMASMAQRAAGFGMTSLIEIRLDEDIEKLKFVSDKVDSEFLACGVNSRDLSNFTIDLLKPCTMQKKIRSVLGENARVIFESGIRTPESAAFAGSMGFAGLLLGEAAAKNPLIRKTLVDSFTGSAETENARFWKKYSLLLSEKENLNQTKPFMKICGLTNKNDAELADSLGADFLGFIFSKKSPRCIKDNTLFAESTKAFKVTVITDTESDEAKNAVELCRSGQADVIQLHGKKCIESFLADEKLRELPHYCAVNIQNEDDVKYLDVLFE